MSVLMALGLLVAVIAAVRSTWSPCGLSMLSTITPLGERGRGNRFRRTAAWFIVGAVAGGATLGGAAGLLAAGWAALAIPTGTTLALGAVGAALAVLGDLGLLGFRTPVLRRQVNERWLDQFRGVIYGVGFGWQIGVGLATYVMTTCVFLTIALAALNAQFFAALAIGMTFGTVRGLAVLVSARATTPEALRRLHRRMDQLSGPVRRATVAVEAAAVVALAAAWWAPSLLLVIPAGVLGLVGLRLVPVVRRRRRVLAPQ